MIREYAPIPLIPAAWAMTFATMQYPGIDTYWIQHMHYFMLLFLTGFTVLSWKEMGKNEVLDIWRKVMAVGILFTGLGAASFFQTGYLTILGFSSISYWYLAPGAALVYSSKHMEKWKNYYRWLGIGSFIAYSLFILSFVFSLTFKGLDILFSGSLLLITVFQTGSILIASKMDR